MRVQSQSWRIIILATSRYFRDLRKRVLHRALRFPPRFRLHFASHVEARGQNLFFFINKKICRDCKKTWSWKQERCYADIWHFSHCRKGSGTFSLNLLSPSLISLCLRLSALSLILWPPFPLSCERNDRRNAKSPQLPVYPGRPFEPFARPFTGRVSFAARTRSVRRRRRGETRGEGRRHAREKTVRNCHMLLET